MDSLGDILGHKKLDEPPEMAAIRNYVKEHFDSVVSVKIQPQSIIITADNAALVGTLRLNIAELQKVTGSTKRLVFRIGR